MKKLDAVEKRLIGRILEVVDDAHERGGVTSAARLGIRGRVISAVHQAGDDIEALTSAGELLHESQGYGQ